MDRVIDATGASRFSLDRDGLAVLGGFLARGELRSLRADVDTVLAGPLPPGCARPHNTLAPLTFRDVIVERLLSCDPRMRRLAGTLDAEDLRWISGYVSVKEPRSDALWWHQDWWCWDHPVTYRRDAPQVAVLCYLSDTTVTSGALRVLPGSHHRSVALHAALPEAHSLEGGELGADHVAMSDRDGQVTIAARAGDAVVADYRLLHGTHPNGSARRRDCVLLTFAPCWRGLPADIRAHLIQHPAQPTDRERSTGGSWRERLLPRFDGPRGDLPLNRVAPRHFAVRA